MTTLNRLDAVLQQVCPAVMVPKYGVLDVLESEGHRFLVGNDGLYLELVRNWLRVRLRVCRSIMPLPYGPVREEASFFLGTRFTELLRRFVEEARQALPNEHAAWLSFDKEAHELAYESVEVNWQNGAHINYQRPLLPFSRQLAIDLHSHGRIPAHFSDDDDKDDIDDAKLSIVVGCLHKEPFDVVARLVLPAGTTCDYTDFVASYF